MQILRSNLHIFHLFVALVTNLQVIDEIFDWYKGQRANKGSLMVRTASYHRSRACVNPTMRTETLNCSLTSANWSLPELVRSQPVPETFNYNSQPFNFDLSALEHCKHHFA